MALVRFGNNRGLLGRTTHDRDDLHAHLSPGTARAR